MVTNSKWIIARKNLSDEDKPKNRKYLFFISKLLWENSSILIFNAQSISTYSQHWLMISPWFSNWFRNWYWIRYLYRIFTIYQQSIQMITTLPHPMTIHHSCDSDRIACQITRTVHNSQTCVNKREL